MLAKRLASLSFVGIVVVAACGTDATRTEFDDSKNKSTDDAAVVGDRFAETDGGKGCTGLECNIASCSDGDGDTTISGTVYAPNGTLPLYNAIVYVPNEKLKDLETGVTCDQCGGVASGAPVVSTLSGPDGTFKLTHAPAGDKIPLVIQMGKWRREVTIPVVKSCVDTKVAASLTHLPRNRTEGNMPTIALTSGGCDKLGCMLPKLGIDPDEIGVAGDGAAKAIHVFRGSGGNGPSGATAANTLWSDLEAMKRYDMLLLSCECAEHKENKGATATSAMTEYLNAGGRIFTTDFMYTWYRDTPDATLKSATSIIGGAPGAASPIPLVTSFPKGLALETWLKTVFPTSASVSMGKVPFDSVYANMKSLDPAKAQSWSAPDVTKAASSPRIFTVNLPAGKPVAEQCGKGVHIDAHVNAGGTDDVNANYPNSCTAPLKEGEAALAFFFFDLSSCIQDDSKPPITPPTN